MTFPLLLTTSSKVTQERLPGKESRRTSASEARPRQQANPGQTPARGRPHASPLRLQDRPRRDCCTFCSLGGTDVARPAFPSSSGKKDAEEERRAQKMRRAKKKKKKRKGPLRANLLPLCAQAASEAGKVESGPPGGSGGPPKGPWARQRSRRASLRGLRPLGRPSSEGLRVRAVRL